MPLNLTGALASRKPSRRVRFAPAARVGVSASSSPPLPLRPQVSADTLAGRSLLADSEGGGNFAA